MYSTGDNTKSPKSIVFYPDGWAKALNESKDVVRASILLTDPFPDAGGARIMVNESFHEVTTTLCNEGHVLEPGMSARRHSIYLISRRLTGLSWNNNMLSIVSKHIYLTVE